MKWHVFCTKKAPSGLGAVAMPEGGRMATHVIRVAYNSISNM